MRACRRPVFTTPINEMHTILLRSIRATPLIAFYMSILDVSDITFSMPARAAAGRWSEFMSIWC